MQNTDEQAPGRRNPQPQGDDLGQPGQPGEERQRKPGGDPEKEEDEGVE